MTAQPASAADPQPSAVSVPGNFDAEVGCPGDWQPDCAQMQLTRRSNDDVWSITLTLPAGCYEYKAALDKSWDVNYGKGAVRGRPEHSDHGAGRRQEVTFYYDNATHWVTDDVNSLIVTAAGDFQSELGCPGDWQPDCLRSWLEDPDGDGIYTFTTTAIPAGDYQVKAAVGLSWDVNYGAGGVLNGPNIPFTVRAAGEPGDLQLRLDLARADRAHRRRLPSLTTPKAYWLSTRYIGWNVGSSAASRTYRLYSAPNGGLAVTDTGITGGTAYPADLRPGRAARRRQGQVPGAGRPRRAAAAGRCGGPAAAAAHRAGRGGRLRRGRQPARRHRPADPRRAGRPRTPARPGAPSA